MAEQKTKPTDETLASYLARVEDPDRRSDCAAIAALMEEATGETPVIWGSGIVGFGLYRYTYASGQSGEWPITGFAARKKDITLYIMPGVEAFPELTKSLGMFKHGKSCLYIKKLADIDERTLRTLVTRGVEKMESQRVR